MRKNNNYPFLLASMVSILSALVALALVCVPLEALAGLPGTYRVWVQTDGSVDFEGDTNDLGYDPDTYGADAGFEYVGQATSTATFTCPSPASVVLIHSPQGESTRLDAVEFQDADGNTIGWIGFNAEGQSVGSYVNTGNILNHSWAEGRPDDGYALMGTMYDISLNQYYTDQNAYYMATVTGSMWDTGSFARVVVHVTSASYMDNAAEDGGGADITADDQTALNQLVTDLINGYQNKDKSLILSLYPSSQQTKVESDLDTIFDGYSSITLTTSSLSFSGKLPRAANDWIFNLSGTLTSGQGKSTFGGGHFINYFVKEDGSWKVFYDTLNSPHMFLLGWLSQNSDYRFWDSPVVSGTVTDSSDQALGGMLVEAYSYRCPQEAPIASTTTDSQGEYSFISLGYGSYYIKADGANANPSLVDKWFDDTYDCASASGVDLYYQDVGGIDFQLDDQSAYIRGTITDGQGAPADGVGVTAYQMMCASGAYYQTTTDSQGDYTLRVLEGAYYVEAGSHGEQPNIAREWYDGADGTTNCGSASAVYGWEGQTAQDIDFQLGQAGHIYGRVDAEDGYTPTSVTVSAYLPNDSGWYSFQAKAHVDVNGDYSLTGLAPEDYILQATADGQNYVSEWWTADGGSLSWTEAGTRTVELDQGTQADFTLSPGGILQGYVRDDQGDPIANCRVITAIGTNACQGNNDWHSTQTDDQGFYQFSGLQTTPDGSGNLRYVQALPGWTSLPYVNEWYNGATGSFACDGAQGLSIAAGATQQVDFDLDDGSSFAGTVTDAQGQPLENWHILVFPACGSVNVASANTDASGNYQVYGLSAGDYYLWAMDDESGDWADEWYTSGGGSSTCDTAEAQTVGAGQTVTGRDFVLDAAAYISGQVLDEQGDPLAGLQVMASDTQCQYDGVTATTYSNGNFWLTVSPGTYYLYVQDNAGGQDYFPEWYDGANGTQDCSAATSVVVAQGETAWNKDFELAAAATVTGQVTDTGMGVEGVRVNAYSGQCWDGQLATTTTDANGDYTLTGLPTGDVYLQACPRCDALIYYQDNWWDGSGGSNTCDNAVAVSVTGGQTHQGYDFPLEVGGAISGRVIDGSGSPIEGVNMQVVGTSIGALTDSNGDYRIEGVPAGDQTVMACATCQNLNYVNEYYDDQTSQDGATAVSVNVGATTPDIDFALTAGALISGTITAPDNSPLEHMGVNLRTDACDSNSRVMGDWTDSEGVYTMIGVPAGSYYIGAWPNYSGFPYRDEFWSSAGDAFACGQAEAVTVSAGQQATGYDIAVNGAPEIDVLDGSTSLPSDSGDKLDFGSVAVGSSTTKTLTIENTGNADLVLDGSPVVMVAGPCDGDYTVTAQPASPVAGGGSTTFTVSFAPTAHGERRAFLVIQNNDPNEDPYVVHLKGWATTTAAQASYAAPSLENVGLFSIQYQGPNGRLVRLGVRATVNGPGPLDARLTLTKPNSDTVNFETVRYRRGTGVEFFWSDSSWTGPPADGQYTLTVTDSAGRTASTTVDFTYAEVPLPVLTSPDNEAHTGSATPTFTMDPAGEGYYHSFQVRSYDRTNNGNNSEGDVILYTSAPDSGSSVTVPAGTLQDNSAYKLLGMTRDTASGNAFNLGLATRYFYTGGTAADLPVADEVLFTTQWENYYDMMRFVWRNPGVAPWEIDYVAITDPDSGVRYPGGFMQTLFEAPSRLVGTLTLSGDAADGDYVVDMQANGHSASRTMPYVLDAVDAVGSSGRSPGHNAYVRPVQGTLSWAPVAGDVQYSVAVYPMDRDTVIWESGLTSEASVTLPDAILQDGDSYEWSVRTWRNATPLNNMGYSKRFVLNVRSTLPSQGASHILAVLLGSATDSDGDGIPDSIENNSCTSATNPDSDGDGIPDGVEDANKNGVVDEGETNPCSTDSDGDGIDDGQEDANHNGVVDEGETDPNKEDTDGDGMPDKYEVDNGLDPLVNDANLDKDGDGYTNKQECDARTLANDASSKPNLNTIAPMLPLILSK